MYDRLLKTIADRMRMYGGEMQSPCSTARLNELQQRAKEELGHDIPGQYRRFLAQVNGLDWNGLVVYASERTPIVGYSDRFIDGFVEANRDLREYAPMNDYLVFADDGVALFVFQLSERKFLAIARIGLASLVTFDSFDGMLASALSDHV